MTCPLIRIDTNQGIYGLGEVRDGASKTYALMLKSRLLGENPCNVDKIFRKIKQFGGHSRQAGGVCGVEMALWDLAGKAYNVPVYQMLGGKFRDKIRCYADTTESHDPKVYGQRLKLRRDQGFTWLKMDLGIDLLGDTPGTLSHPAGADRARDVQHAAHVHRHRDHRQGRRHDGGLRRPGARDHRDGRAAGGRPLRPHRRELLHPAGQGAEKYNMAWLEDMIPWQYTDLWKKITDAIDMPTLTGEDIYLKEPFIELARNHAVDILHPDLATSGGILETKKIGDAIQEYGVRHGHAFRGHAGILHGERALRRGHGEFPGAGKSLGRRARGGATWWMASRSPSSIKDSSPCRTGRDWASR